MLLIYLNNYFYDIIRVKYYDKKVSEKATICMNIKILNL